MSDNVDEEGLNEFNMEEEIPGGDSLISKIDPAYNNCTANNLNSIN
jgi:hypothetical protein